MKKHNGNTGGGHAGSRPFVLRSRKEEAMIVTVDTTTGLVVSIEFVGRDGKEETK